MQDENSYKTETYLCFFFPSQFLDGSFEIQCEVLTAWHLPKKKTGHLSISIQMSILMPQSFEFAYSA